MSNNRLIYSITGQLSAISGHLLYSPPRSYFSTVHFCLLYTLHQGLITPRCTFVCFTLHEGLISPRCTFVCYTLHQGLIFPRCTFVFCTLYQGPVCALRTSHFCLIYSPWFLMSERCTCVCYTLDDGIMSERRQYTASLLLPSMASGWPVSSSCRLPLITLIPWTVPHGSIYKVKFNVKLISRFHRISKFHGWI